MWTVQIRGESKTPGGGTPSGREAERPFRIKLPYWVHLFLISPKQ
jgi:hypothetical protein